MKYLFLLLSVILLLSGCHTPEYYQDKAVQAAREFLLERAPELSPKEIAFIRYTRPALLTAPIFGDVSGSGKIISGSGFGQICVAWIIPSRDPVYMVYGASQGNMRGWSPERVIRKVFRPVNRRKLAAWGTGRDYVLRNLYHELSAGDYNYIRYAVPEIRETDFEPVPGSGNVSAKGNPPAGLRQLSMVWNLPRSPGKVLVIIGYGTSDLATWVINTAGIQDAAALDGTALLEEPANGVFDGKKGKESKK